MDLHQNARLTFRSREALAIKVMVEGVTLNAAAAAFNVSAKTAAKWARRYRDLGRAGLRDRSSRPHRCPRRTAAPEVERILTLRRQRWTGIRIRRVLADNAPCYYSFAFARACRQLGIRHLRTRPYTPRTNGKAERFIQTALREWAYARIYQNSDHRRAELDPWPHQYNWHRPPC